METGALQDVVAGYRRSWEASDEDGRAARPARAVAWVEPAMASWEQGLLHQVMIDRFRGAGGAALSPPATPGSRAGGTLDGVRAEIERGTFEALGVTALWLSPVYRNPVEVRETRDGHLSEGYHGYWPEEARVVDDRLGGEAALRGVIDAAHRRGLRVIFDLVSNHVYEASSRYVEASERRLVQRGSRRLRLRVVRVRLGQPSADVLVHLVPARHPVATSGGDAHGRRGRALLDGRVRRRRRAHRRRPDDAPGHDEAARRGAPEHRRARRRSCSPRPPNVPRSRCPQAPSPAAPIWTSSRARPWSSPRGPRSPSIR